MKEKEVIMMVMIRGSFSSFPARTCSFIFQGEKKNPGSSFCFERLDLIFAQAGHRILCLIVSHKQPSLEQYSNGQHHLKHFKHLQVK